MATYQPTRRPRPRRRASRPMSLGALLLVLFIGYIFAKTYPLQTGAVVVFVAVAAVIHVTHPRRLAGLLSRIDHVIGRVAVSRPALPSNAVHHLRTFERMKPAQFEQAIAQLAKRTTGVHSASVHGGANDRGLDVLVCLKDGRRILIQCKRYTGTNRVSSEDVQKVNGTWSAIHGCDMAAIVTTSGFTRSAVDTNLMFNPPIRLMGGAGLVQWANGGTPPWG